MAVNDNRWHHAELVSVGTTQFLYFDSSLITSLSGTVNNSWWTHTTIGTGHMTPTRGGSSTRWDYFTGSIDQVRIYNYARTPAQIAWDYNKGKPIGWWKMDECQGTQIADWSGNGNHGTLSIGASGTQVSVGTCSIGNTSAWSNGSAGKINSSLNFDGTDDYINVGNPAALNFGTGNFTISSWINLSGSGDRTIVDKGNLSFLTNNGYNLMVSGGKLRFAIADGTDGYTVNTAPLSNTTLNNGVWYHALVIWNSSSQTATYYLNGVNDGSYTTSNIDSTTGANPFRIGIKYDTRLFSGKIDDVQIYNYALTPQQVKTVYNGGSMNFQN